MTWLAAALALWVGTADAQNIQTSEIDALGAEAVGLIDPAVADLPTDLLSGSDAGRLAELFPAISRDTPPAVTDLLRAISKARLAPPITTEDTSPFLLRRIQHLNSVGEIDAAEAMLRQIGTTDPVLFDEWLNAALWLGLEVEACEAINRVPRPKTLQSVIFCTGLNGDPLKAIILTEAAASVGELTETEAGLFLYFLDPEIFEGIDIGEASEVKTPLAHHMRADLGFDLPKVKNSLGPEVKARRGLAPWRDQVVASETLAGLGAISGSALFEKYRENTPPASGDLWDRVGFAQAKADLTEARAIAGYKLFANAGLGNAYADAVAPDITDDLSKSDIGKCILTLAGVEDAPSADALRSETASPLLFMIRDSAIEAPRANAEDLMVALTRLASPNPDLRGLGGSLATLRALGFKNWADQIAMQIYARQIWCPNG